jgi:hypothetical protein
MSGVSDKTSQRLVLDSGVVYLNWQSTDLLNPQRVLGACRGGNTFTVEREWRDMPVDGIHGIVEGMRRPLGATVTLTANLLEINKDLLKVALPGAEYELLTQNVDGNGEPVTTPPNGEKQYSIRAALTAAIPKLNYNDVAIVAKYSGTELPVVCIVKKAIATSNLEMSFTDQDESVLAITFTGAYSVSELDKDPFEIIWPEGTPA